MISLLRKKHQTTQPAKIPGLKKVCSLLLAAGWLASASAQEPAPLPNTDSPGRPLAEDYKILRGGNSLQLKKPANSNGLRDVRSVAENAPPAATQPSRLLPVAAMRQTPNAGLGSDPKKPVDPSTTLQPPVIKPGDPLEKPLAFVEDKQAYQVRTTLPGMEELFRIESEKGLQSRIQKEMGNKDELPAQPTLATSAFAGRSFQPSQIVAEPHYVCYGKLLFEERNAERYGWDLGFIQPAVSLASFYKDVIFLPYHLASRPHQRECSPKCLPGDSVPYMVYHEGATVSGVLAETGIVLALALIVFP
jgi:hypothetical protein